VDAAAVAGVGGDAGAGAYAQLQSVIQREVGFLKVLMDGAREAQGFFAGGRWHEDDEFVATVAEAEVGGAAELADAAADVAEQFAADEMAVLVVDGFEAIEVEEDEAERFGFVAGDVQLGLKQGVEMAGVEEAGDVVGDGKLLCVGDVLSVFDGDGGVIDQDVQEGDRLVGVLVEMRIEDFEDAVGAFATSNGQADGGAHGKCVTLRGCDEAGVGGCFRDDEGFAGVGDPAGEAFTHFDAHIGEAGVFAAIGPDVVKLFPE
jgi:hypothetical protein